MLLFPTPRISLIAPPPIYGCFVYLALPICAICVNGHPSERLAPPQKAATRNGSAHGVITDGVRSLWIPGSVCSPPLSRPARGGFLYLEYSRLAEGDSVRPEGRPPIPTETRGTIRVSKTAELGKEAAIVWMRGSVFSPPFCTSPMYGGFWFLSFRRWLLALRRTSPGTPKGPRIWIRIGKMA